MSRPVEMANMLELESSPGKLDNRISSDKDDIALTRLGKKPVLRVSQ
jgi:hypothetical protein